MCHPAWHPGRHRPRRCNIPGRRFSCVCNSFGCFSLNCHIFCRSLRSGCFCRNIGNFRRFGGGFRHSLGSLHFSRLGHDRRFGLGLITATSWHRRGRDVIPDFIRSGFIRDLLLECHGLLFTGCAIRHGILVGTVPGVRNLIRTFPGVRNLVRTFPGVRNLVRTVPGVRNLVRTFPGVRNLVRTVPGDRNLVRTFPGVRNLVRTVPGVRNLVRTFPGVRNLVRTVPGDHNLVRTFPGVRNIDNIRLFIAGGSDARGIFGDCAAFGDAVIVFPHHEIENENQNGQCDDHNSEFLHIGIPGPVMVSVSAARREAGRLRHDRRLYHECRITIDRARTPATESSPARMIGTETRYAYCHRTVHHTLRNCLPGLRGTAWPLS